MRALHSTRGGGGLTPCGKRWRRRVPSDHSERVDAAATSYDALVTCRICLRHLARSPSSRGEGESDGQ